MYIFSFGGASLTILRNRLLRVLYHNQYLQHNGFI